MTTGYLLMRNQLRRNPLDGGRPITAWWVTRRTNCAVTSPTRLCAA